MTKRNGDQAGQVAVGICQLAYERKQWMETLFHCRVFPPPNHAIVENFLARRIDALEAQIKAATDKVGVRVERMSPEAETTSSHDVENES